MALAIGTVLNNRYRIEQTIAAGGMGAVYRAIDESLNIPVAVKENFFTSDEYSRQFRREATILASLRHTHLPRVTDHFVIADQGQYLVMDFIDGPDLRDLITNRGGLPEEDVARIGAAICDALTYLHGRNPAIVHRDIKPGNIKITPKGQVFLVDFGLAKLAFGEATATGAQGLTPGYAPPEQYGQGTEPRSDQYALGATLYAALTGKIPEDGLSRAMGSADLTPIRKHRPQVTDGIARAIEHAMAVQPSERYESAEAFKKAILQAAPYAENALVPGLVAAHVKTQIDSKPVRYEPTALDRPKDTATVASRHAIQADKPAPVKLPSRRAFPLTAVLGIGGVAVVMGLALMIFLLPKLLPKAPAAPTAAPTAVATNTVSLPTSTAPAAPTAVPATPTTRAIPSATTKPKPTTGPVVTDTPVLPTSTIAPTEKNAAIATPIGGEVGQIAFASDRSGKVQIWVMNSDGGDLRQVTDVDEGACQPDWSPDGKRLVFISPCNGNKEEYQGAGLFLIDADGNNLQALQTTPGGDFDPAWSPDGIHIAFTSVRDSIPYIYIMDLTDETKLVNLSTALNRERRAAWSPDGLSLAYETTRQGGFEIWIMSADGKNAHPLSNLTPIFGFMPDWAKDAATLIYSKGTNQPMLVSRQVKNQAAKEFYVSETVHPVEDAHFSPDNFWVAFASRQNGNTDIYRMKLNGGGLKQLTDTPGLDFDPVWRPGSK